MMCDRSRKHGRQRRWGWSHDENRIHFDFSGWKFSASAENHRRPIKQWVSRIRIFNSHKQERDKVPRFHWKAETLADSSRFHRGWSSARLLFPQQLESSRLKRRDFVVILVLELQFRFLLQEFYQHFCFWVRKKIISCENEVSWISLWHLLNLWVPLWKSPKWDYWRKLKRTAEFRNRKWKLRFVQRHVKNRIPAQAKTLKFCRLEKSKFTGATFSLT